MSLGVLLTVIFTVLKLVGFVHWTWPGVFIPFFIELGFDFLVMLGVIGFAVFVKK